MCERLEPGFVPVDFSGRSSLSQKTIVIHNALQNYLTVKAVSHEPEQPK